MMQEEQTVSAEAVRAGLTAGRASSFRPTPPRASVKHAPPAEPPQRRLALVCPATIPFCDPVAGRTRPGRLAATDGA